MKTIVKTITLISAVSMLLASTCKKEELPRSGDLQLNTPFEVPLKGKVFIDSEGLELTVNEVTDARCPVDVQCFWAGNAKVKLNVLADGSENQLSFCIGQCDTRYQKADTLQVEYHDKPYSLILTEVKPYPGAGNVKKSAVFVLQRR